MAKKTEFEFRLKRGAAAAESMVTQQRATGNSQGEEKQAGKAGQVKDEVA